MHMCLKMDGYLYLMWASKHTQQYDRVWWMPEHKKEKNK